MSQVNSMKWIRNPAYIYLFKDNNRNTGKSGDICSKLADSVFHYISKWFLRNMFWILNNIYYSMSWFLSFAVALAPKTIHLKIPAAGKKSQKEKTETTYPLWMRLWLLMINLEYQNWYENCWGGFVESLWIL